MADMFSPSKRSEIMSRIRSKDTAAELMVFRFLRNDKVHFQKHYKRVPGSPDIALPRKKRAVFIDGDFWHGRTYERVLAKYGPDNYWSKKIARNMERDEAQRLELKRLGWHIVAVWESDLMRKRTQADTLEFVRHFLVE